MQVPKECTLLDLLRNVNEVTEDEREAVATVVYLINSGRVRLCGNFAGAKLRLPVSAEKVAGAELPHRRIPKMSIRGTSAPQAAQQPRARGQKSSEEFGS